MKLRVKGMVFEWACHWVAVFGIVAIDVVVPMLWMMPRPRLRHFREAKRIAKESRPSHDLCGCNDFRGESAELTAANVWGSVVRHWTSETATRREMSAEDVTSRSSRLK